MAHMLVQQQTHPPLKINNHRTSSQNNNLVPMSRSLDDAYYFYTPDPDLLQLFQRMTSEPSMPMHYSTSNGSVIKNPTDSSLSNTFLPIDQSENCDKIEPVTTIEIANRFVCLLNIQKMILTKIYFSDQSDNSLTATINDELDEDVIINTNASLNTDRHFRRRKRRSSLTRSSSSNDETETIEKLDNNNNNQDEKSQEISDNSQPVTIESLSLNENNEKKDDNVVENTESNDKAIRSGHFRGRSK
jgi:hypothetical protein